LTAAFAFILGVIGVSAATAPKKSDLHVVVVGSFLFIYFT